MRFPFWVALLLFALTAHADDEAEVRPVYGARAGYLFNVVEEKDKREIEMVMLEPPKEKKKPLNKVIFDEKLTKEFQDQYRYRFGETAEEQVINNPGRDDQYTYYSQTVSVQDYQHYQQQFANYMLRRLGEYHLDKYMKNEPSLKSVYEAKDKFSNLDVKVKSGWKLKWKYNISGPSMEVQVENPYQVQTKVQVMMNGLISKPADIIYTIGYKINPRVNVELLYKQTEQLIQTVVTRKMSKHMSISATASSGQLPNDSVDYQNLFLIGLTLNDLPLF